MLTEPTIGPPQLSPLVVSDAEQSGILASVVIGQHASVSALSDEQVTDWSSLGKLHDDERQMALAMAPTRRAGFIAGRVALRAALGALDAGRPTDPILHTPRGAPALPAGVIGSISHKATRAVAVVVASERGFVGVDLETRANVADIRRPSIASRILTAREQDAIRLLDPVAHRDATLLRFSLKEAVYKAIDPIVARYVRFSEVELDVTDDGMATVRLLLPEFASSAPTVHARWHADNTWFISAARVWYE